MSDPVAVVSRWLWLSAELPTTRSTGRLVYSASLVEALAADGIELHVVGLGTAPAPVTGVTWHPVDAPLRGGWRSLLSPLPNLSYACSVPALRVELGRLLEAEWDVVVVDHLQAAWSIDAIEAAHRGPVVFVCHNYEAGVRRDVARKAPWRSGRRAVLSFDAWKAARLERRVARTADVVTSITADDRALIARDAPGRSHVLLPPGWSNVTASATEPADPAGASAGVVSPPPMDARPRRAGILGSFEWHVKQENLRRFVRDADPVFHAAGVELLVGGRVPEDFRRELEPGLRAVRFVGWVDSTASFLAECRIGVIAEPLGGGFKMKSLDYVFGRVVVASEAGSIAGLPLVHGVSKIEADDGSSLARAIVAAIDDASALERLADNAIGACAREFSWASRSATLVAAISDLEPAHR